MATAPDPIQSAADAGLRYVRDTTKGYQRRRAGRGFCILDLAGKPIRDKAELSRIRSLVIPPAWTKVWICPSPHGHLQAVGVDARGRRQYRYHPHYRHVRNQTKFGRMPDFAKALPGIRKRVQRDLSLPGLPREKVLATVVRLLETTFIRVGNAEYARENSSFGLTTLRDRHVDIVGANMRFHFRGKSGQEHEVTLQDRRLARIVKQCQDLPGYELFQYVDEASQRRGIDSSDVNAYLREMTGEDFTAKDFRTWAGTMQSALALAEIGPFASETEAKRNIVAAVKETASRLGNRPATCRNYYVHPSIVESYLDGTLLQTMKPPPDHATAGATELSAEEECVLALIRKKAARLTEAA